MLPRRRSWDGPGTWRNKPSRAMPRTRAAIQRAHRSAAPIALQMLLFGCSFKDAVAATVEDSRQRRRNAGGADNAGRGGSSSASVMRPAGISRLRAAFRGACVCAEWRQEALDATVRSTAQRSRISNVTAMTRRQTYATANAARLDFDPLPSSMHHVPVGHRGEVIPLRRAETMRLANARAGSICSPAKCLWMPRRGTRRWRPAALAATPSPDRPRQMRLPRTARSAVRTAVTQTAQSPPLAHPGAMSRLAELSSGFTQADDRDPR